MHLSALPPRLSKQDCQPVGCGTNALLMLPQIWSHVEFWIQRCALSRAPACSLWRIIRVTVSCYGYAIPYISTNLNKTVHLVGPLLHPAFRLHFPGAVARLVALSGSRPRRDTAPGRHGPWRCGRNDSNHRPFAPEAKNRCVCCSFYSGPMAAMSANCHPLSSRASSPCAFMIFAISQHQP
jgi:hypothetical protein